MTRLFAYFLIATLGSFSFAADSAPGPWRPLLDTKLSNFDVYLSFHGKDILDVIHGKASAQPIGLNPPGQDVFTVNEQDGKPVLRISGEIYGCLQTRESFGNYHLRLETRWGEKKWVPRLDEPKDSGILYHSRGPFGVDYWKSWALSHEFQVIEHGLGEYWTQATSAMDIRADAGKPGALGADAPRWNPDAPWQVFASPNNHALAGTDQDRVGGWNRLELVCFEDDCVHIVNGKVVMALHHARYREGDQWVPMKEGRLQIQSEAAEVFYRNIEIRRIAAMPAELAGYFTPAGGK